MTNTMPFADVLEAADRLPVDDREMLIDILRRRLAEEGRRRIVQEVGEADEEFAAGGGRRVTVDELMDEILS